MRFNLPSFVLLTTFLTLRLCSSPASAQQADTDHFELRGRVINIATGEPVSGALVQVYSSEQKSQFTGAEGKFAFTDIPRGQFSLTARKPGFFNEQELGRGNVGMNSLTIVPRDGDVLLELTPEGIIYGQLKNENGDPIEGLYVRAQRWQAVNGKRQLADVGDAGTDDQGMFRIAELQPGSYYLSFHPGNANGGWTVLNELRRKPQADEGYGSMFYPGVPDVESARAIEIRPGARVQIAQTLRPQRLFQVAGVVRGANPENGFSLLLMDNAGATVQKRLRVNSQTGEFQIEGIPAGTYMLWANANLRTRAGENEDQPRLSVKLPIHVHADLSGVVVALDRGISVGVQVRDQVLDVGNPDHMHQVSVTVTAKELPLISQTIRVPPVHGDRGTPTRFEGLFPGTYAVEVTPNLPGYVASLQCGSVDLLRDDLTVASGATLPPIEVTLRNDGAELNGTVIENGQPAAAAVVIYSEEYPRRSLLIQAGTGSFSISNLAPGTYQVVALKDAQDLEFRNPAAMEKYVRHSEGVTLGSGGKATRRIEVQRLEEQQ